MIMTRSPLRISLGGGGTDLPSYYQEHSGFVIAAAIDKYRLHHDCIVDSCPGSSSSTRRWRRWSESRTSSTR